MSALICGSLAFDTIATYDGRFADAILPEQIHILNVSFLVPTLRREFGGCAGNIAYALKQLGGEPAILAPLGSDGQDYLQRLRQLGMDTTHVPLLPDHFTAQAIITTDRDNNQITAFHPGAMNEAHRFPVPDDPALRLGVVAPDGRSAMIDHARQMHAAGIPFIFDPGQGLPMFDGEVLRTFIGQATWVAANDYEARLLVERTGWSIAEIAQRIPGAFFVTLGADGCDVWEQGQCTRAAPVKAAAVLDPTGCGDAFRGALLYGLERGWAPQRCAALGNRLGALKIAQRGAQNYHVPADLVPVV